MNSQNKDLILAEYRGDSIIFLIGMIIIILPDFAIDMLGMRPSKKRDYWITIGILMCVGISLVSISYVSLIKDGLKGYLCINNFMKIMLIVGMIILRILKMKKPHFFD